MNKYPWLMEINPKLKDETDYCLRYALAPALEKAGAENISVWSVGTLVFGYFEADAPDAEAFAAFEAQAGECFRWIARPGEMRLMYDHPGVVRADKGLVRHRVFMTVLKPGCAEEYKRRHDELTKAQSGQVKDGRESNMTIWNAESYICGYCEIVKAFEKMPTQEEKESNIRWEKRQLEIMDWLTDDVDWITGESHPSVRRIYPSV